MQTAGAGPTPASLPLTGEDPALTHTYSLKQLTPCPLSAPPPARSISSSSAVTPSEVAVTVGLLTYKLPNGAPRHGFCSRYITQLRPGDRVRFKLTSQPAFRQPLNLEVGGWCCLVDVGGWGKSGRRHCRSVFQSQWVGAYAPA